MATEQDFGIDLACVDDCDPGFKLVSGRRLLAESLARRITMDPGSVIDCPDDGIDVRDALGDVADDESLSELAATVRAEMLKDERVVDVRVNATLEIATPEERTLLLECIVTDGEGPFPLTLEVSAVNTKLLLDAAA